MARKRAAPLVTVGTVTLDRAIRLYRLIRLLGPGPQSRTTLTRKLRLGVRGFYRDLEALRAVHVEVALSQGKYTLLEDVAGALEKLPFPDPCLSLGEARLLARGRSRGHAKIREQLHKIEK